MDKSNSHNRLMPPLWFFTLALIAFSFWLVVELKEIVALLVVAYSISYAIDPPLDYLERKNISRPVGVFVVFGVLLVTIALLMATALPMIAREYQALSDNLPDYLATAKEKATPMLNHVTKYLPDGLIEGDPNKLLEYIPTVDAKSVGRIVEAIGQTLMKGYSATLTIVNLFLLPFFVFYISANFNGMQQRVLALLPYQARSIGNRIMQDIDGSVSAYIRGQLTVCAVLFVLYAIGLGLMGVELWLLLAVVAGFGNMIPYLGSAVGILLASIMALVTFGSFSFLLGVWALFAVIQFLEGTFITPKIVGDRTGLSPLVVIIAIVAGGTLFGLLGIFLAVPVAAGLRVIFKELHDWLLERARTVPTA